MSMSNSSHIIADLLEVINDSAEENNVILKATSLI